MMTFEDYINGYIHKTDYHMEEVKKNFNKVISILGEEYENDYIASITIRLMNKVNGIPTDWITANSVANALQIIISKRFWGRRSRKQKIPYISSIESSKGWDKEHLHILIRFKDLKEPFEDFELDAILRGICNSLKEVNEKTPDAVKIRIYPFLENQYKVVGNAIHYICKSSTTTYNPLLRQLKDGCLINQ
jgi:hypothetical protein